MLNDSLMIELDFSTELTPSQRFEEFNSRNPQVYQALEDMAFQLVKRGRKKIGINMLLEVLRWNYYMKTDDPNSEFKINNNYAPYYSRLLIERNPTWVNVFELRTIRSR